MSSLRGGPLEHLKHLRDALDRAEKRHAEFLQAATCRRKYEALVDASIAEGEFDEEYDNLPDDQKRHFTFEVEELGGGIWERWDDFEDDCSR